MQTVRKKTPKLTTVRINNICHAKLLELATMMAEINGRRIYLGDAIEAAVDQVLKVETRW